MTFVFTGTRPARRPVVGGQLPSARRPCWQPSPWYDTFYPNAVTARDNRPCYLFLGSEMGPPRALRQAEGQTRNSAGRGRPAGFDRHPAAGGRQGHGLPHRLLARPDDAEDRRPLPRRVQDRREGRIHHRGRSPRDAPHAAGDRRRGRDDRRTGDDRRFRRRPRRRGDPGRESAPRPADTDPSLAGASAGAAVAAPSRPCPAGAVRVVGQDPQGQQATADHVVTAEDSKDGRAAGRGHLRRVGRADRHRSGHRGGRADRPSLAGSLTAVLDRASCWRGGSRNSWRPTLFPRSRGRFQQSASGLEPGS